MYSWQPERGAWQSAVHLRAVCQEVFPVVAICGIWQLANDRIPVPAILHRQFPCLFDARLRWLAADCLGLNAYTNGLSWQTISWYYPFKSWSKVLEGKILLAWLYYTIRNLMEISHTGLLPVVSCTTLSAIIYIIVNKVSITICTHTLKLNAWKNSTFKPFCGRTESVITA
jgi:hypothetical protein